MYGPSRFRCHSANCGSSVVNCAPRKDGPLIEIHTIHNTDLIAILQVSAHALQIHTHVNTVPLQFIARTDAREHQELGRVERSTGKNYLA